MDVCVYLYTHKSLQNDLELDPFVYECMYIHTHTHLVASAFLRLKFLKQNCSQVLSKNLHFHFSNTTLCPQKGVLNHKMSVI